MKFKFILNKWLSEGCKLLGCEPIFLYPAVGKYFNLLVILWKSIGYLEN